MDMTRVNHDAHKQIPHAPKSHTLLQIFHNFDRLRSPPVMGDSLVDALQRVDLAGDSLGNEADDWIDSILDEQRPRKRVKQSSENLKRELEQKYLTPSTSFSTSWLDKLQQ
jgi:hypothetical protein